MALRQRCGLVSSSLSLCSLRILTPVLVQLDWQFIDGKWKKRLQLSPSVALAVTNTVSNLCLAIAIGQGVAIAWWRTVGSQRDSESIT
jgi:hypothetical protein